MSHGNEISRRDFIAKSASVAGSFVVAFHLPVKMFQGLAQAAEPLQPSYPPNAFLKISPDNKITLTVNRLEMGQGVNSAFAQLIAEELGCDFSQIESVASNADAVYNTPGMPFIITGGSMSIRTSYEQYRNIGAGMREMLEAAACDRWKVSLGSVKSEHGFVTHPLHGKMSFGELAEAAAQKPFPAKPKLRSAKNFSVIGQAKVRSDAKAKSDGSAIFGIDVRLPGMLFATITRPPLGGLKLKSIDESAAKKIAGVVDVVRFGDLVGVIAKNTHAAIKGQAALAAVYDLGEQAKSSSEEWMNEFKKHADAGGVIAENRGNTSEAMKKVQTIQTLDYEFPFLAHAPMEPLNITVDFDGKRARLYGGLQMPTGDRQMAAKVFGIPLEQVEINVTYAGGSFGRRANKIVQDTQEVCELAKIVKKPIQVVWSRENDMRGGFYRPLNFHRVKLGFDAHKKLAVWDHSIVGQSIMQGTMMEPMMIKNGVEETVVEGVKGTKYDLPHFTLQQNLQKTPMSTLWWRSVGSTHTAYVMETAIDEVAVHTGVDPIALRRKLLKKSKRHLAVLDLLQKESGWGKRKLAAGRALGVAIHESFESVVGHVLEVSIENNFPRVHKVWSAAHVGRAVNPDGVASQIEGGVVFALSAILYQQIEWKNGQIVQGNFDQYPVLRMADTPEVSVYIVPSDDPPTGIGEPGVPPVGPALANAVFRLTGKRIRKLPFVKGWNA